MRLAAMPGAEFSQYQPGGRADALQVWQERDRLDPWPRSLCFWMVALYMALFLIRPWELIFPWMNAIPIERIVAIGTLLLLILSGRFWLHITAQTATILLFLGTSVASAFLGLDPSGSLGHLYKYLTVLAWFFLLNSVVENPRALLAIQTWWLFVMGIYMSRSLQEFLLFGRYDHHQHVIRLLGIESTYGNVNEFAGCITFSLPALYFVFRCRNEFPHRYRRLLNLSLAFYLAIALVCIVLTNSRAGVVKAMFFFFLLSMRGAGLSKKVLRLAAGLVFLLVIWILMPEANRDRVRTMWDNTAGPEMARHLAKTRFQAEGFWIGLGAFESSPLTGVGVGNFAVWRSEYLDGKFLEAHNLLGQALGETGALGTTAFVAMFAVILVNFGRVRSVARTLPDPRLRLLSEAAASGRDTVLLLLVSGFTGHNMFFYHWIWLASFAQCAAHSASAIAREPLAGAARVRQG